MTDTLDIGSELLEKDLLALNGEFQPAPAEVIAPTFRQDGVDILRQTILQERNVFMNELFLEGNGECTDESFACSSIH